MRNKEILQKLEESLTPENNWIINNLITIHVSGSRLYGINRPDSDYDIRGITLAPKEYWVGAKTFEQFKLKLPEHNLDFIIFDFRKWLSLAVRMNPNVIETLFVQDDNPNLIYASREWKFIKGVCDGFINKQAFQAFGGYSSAQLKKMVIKQSNKTGRQYITEEFGFDLKFASHGFRLINQGIELLTDGKITFPRPDAAHLLAIREGKVYGPNDMEKCIEDWKRENERLKEAHQNSDLPTTFDFDLYNDLLVTIFDKYVYND